MYVHKNKQNNATCHIPSQENNNKHDANREFEQHECVMIITKQLCHITSISIKFIISLCCMINDKRI